MPDTTAHDPRRPAGNGLAPGDEHPAGIAFAPRSTSTPRNTAVDDMTLTAIGEVARAAAIQTTPGGANFVAQPTLVVGAGGIGHRIVLNLKALLVGIHGHVPAGIRLLVFDIDEEHLSLPVGDRLVTLERDSEVFCLGPIPVARIRQNLDNLPTIAERLPCLRDLPPIATARAAKAIRPLGALAFQWQFPHLRSIVQRAVWSLASRDEHGDAALAVDPGRGLKVLELGSLCGGTHSGFFIELGRLLRSELENLGTLGDACVCIGLGLLPGAFRGAASPSLVPNTAAALKELEAVMLGDNTPAVYRDGTRLQPAQPPFDMYLLVDAIDEGGRVWTSRDDLCRMVARAILVLASTQLGEQGDVELDNLDEVLAARTADGRGTFFGSLGLGALEFPADAVLAACAWRHLHAVVENGLLRPPSDADAQTASQWVKRLGLDAETLCDALTRDDTGAPLDAAPDTPPHIRQAPDTEAPALAAEYLAAWERVQINTDGRAWIRQNGQALAARVKSAARTHIAALAQDPRAGIAAAGSAAQTFLAALAERQSSLAADIDRLRADRQQRQRDAGLHAEALTRAAAGSWFGRHARVMHALEDTFEAARASFEAAMAVHVAEQSAALLADAAETCEDLVRQLARLTTRLNDERDRAARARTTIETGLTEHTGHPALALVDPPYLDRLYDRHAPEVDVTIGRLLRHLAGGLLSAADSQPDALVRTLHAVCRAPFEPIAAMTVEDVVAERTAFSPRARLGALLQAALPAVNLDLTRLPGGDAALRRVDVVGVPNQAESIFRAEAAHVVSLHDPHAILAMSVTVGIPYTALQAWPAYEAEYARGRRLRALHTLPAFQARQHEHRLALALGLAFGMIDTRGTWFYYRPADPLDPEVRLGQGGENAAAALGRDERSVGAILQRVDAHIDRAGTEQALGVLDAWCAPAPGDDDLARDLKRQARDHAALMRQSNRLRGAP